MSVLFRFRNVQWAWERVDGVAIAHIFTFEFTTLRIYNYIRTYVSGKCVGLPDGSTGPQPLSTVRVNGKVYMPCRNWHGI